WGSGRSQGKEWAISGSGNGDTSLRGVSSPRESATVPALRQVLGQHGIGTGISENYNVAKVTCSRFPGLFLGRDSHQSPSLARVASNPDSLTPISRSRVPVHPGQLLHPGELLHLGELLHQGEPLHPGELLHQGEP